MLQKQWTTISEWKMLCFGRGYFEFSFASYEDLRSFWVLSTVSLKPGVLRLFEWTKDLNAHTCPSVDLIVRATTRVLEGSNAM
jgi:hypothetical protein